MADDVTPGPVPCDATFLAILVGPRVLPPFQPADCSPSWEQLYHWTLQDVRYQTLCTHTPRTPAPQATNGFFHSISATLPIGILDSIGATHASFNEPLPGVLHVGSDDDMDNSIKCAASAIFLIANETPLRHLYLWAWITVFATLKSRLSQLLGIELEPQNLPSIHGLLRAASVGHDLLSNASQSRQEIVNTISRYIATLQQLTDEIRTIRRFCNGCTHATDSSDLSSSTPETISSTRSK